MRAGEIGCKGPEETLGLRLRAAIRKRRRLALQRATRSISGSPLRFGTRARSKIDIGFKSIHAARLMRKKLIDCLTPGRNVVCEQADAAEQRIEKHHAANNVDGQGGCRAKIGKFRSETQPADMRAEPMP